MNAAGNSKGSEASLINSKADATPVPATIREIEDRPGPDTGCAVVFWGLLVFVAIMAAAAWWTEKP